VSLNIWVNMEYMFCIIHMVLKMINIGGYIIYVKIQKFGKIILLIKSSEGVRL
jgi:hypothetical protein